MHQGLHGVRRRTFQEMRHRKNRECIEGTMSQVESLIVCIGGESNGCLFEQMN